MQPTCCAGARKRLSLVVGWLVRYADDGGIEFRHYMDDIFDGLFDSGLSIQRVYEEPYSRQQDSEAPAGSRNHQRAYVAGGFVIIARKEQEAF